MSSSNSLITKPRRLEALRKAVRNIRKHKTLKAIGKDNFGCCSSCAIGALDTMMVDGNKHGAVFWHAQDEEQIQVDHVHIRVCVRRGRRLQPFMTQVAAYLRTSVHPMSRIEWNGDPRQCITVHL